MEAISREFRVALPWELLYADDLAVIAEIEEELIKRLNEWKENVESKGMRVNMNKTKVMISGERQMVWHAGSKTLHQQNPPVVNWRCRLTRVELPSAGGGAYRLAAPGAMTCFEHVSASPTACALSDPAPSSRRVLVLVTILLRFISPLRERSIVMSLSVCVRPRCLPASISPELRSRHVQSSPYLRQVT